jgi:alkanesulfonate monooxygenase SsuD/methylene tetrahydromethanopterin reductase-like flavin-dependent oxidoreductase (luciferase family)
VLAKMAESFDRLSGGRLILGLGGGAVDEEFRAFGLPVRSPRDKVDGLEEAIRIARGMWSRPGFTFEGRLYRTDAADLEPKPDRHIPIWLGTYGNRALALTGRLADGWIPSLAYAPPERVAAMREHVLAAASAAGRDPGEITCAYNVGVRVDERAEAPDRPGHPVGVPRTPPSSVVAGSPDAVAERLLGFRRLGFDALSLIPVGPGEREQAERLGRDVLPALRAAA